MVRVPSTMLPLGTTAPDFRLEEPATARQVARTDFSGAPALLVVFLSNHCPFVRHIADALSAFAKEYGARGLAMVGINANDVANFPDDSPERMKDEVALRAYPFPYLFDETQDVAKAYQAACTPDFFLFDGDRRLVYRGQFDPSRPGNDEPVTGRDLRRACDAVLAGELVSGEQTPSIGCNIKWKPGNHPPWFG
ncbi:MAG: thioredoxin family protein [Longimicrobiales bacterium]|nr:thioredoxin family protein [Longimicrobiales bacterium]